MTLQLLGRTLLLVRFLCCFHLFNIVNLIFPTCVVICNSVALAGARELNIKQPLENDTDWNYNTPGAFFSVDT